ncbi:uncharacterized protein TNCV_2809701 [Trichonephila clavipes]|nr:uncharacterized protein TNCV_2809701 [Trichonephila clavipes]
MMTDLTAVKGFILSLVWQFIKTIIKEGVDSSNGTKTRLPLFPIFISEFCLAMKRTSGRMALSTNKTAAFKSHDYFFIPELNSHDVQELWFQQDGATCHTARATIDLLKDTFAGRLISRFGPVNWPPRSCDLTPLDYFLWGYVISLVYADKPPTLDHLEDSIRRVIADIRPQMLEKSSKNGRPDWTTSEPAVAVLCQKSYLKCNATRLSFE